MVLEVLIHPRALSLIDSASETNVNGAKHRVSGSIYSGGQKGNSLYLGGTLGKGDDDPESDDDDLYKSWLGNVGEVDIADTLTENNTTIVGPFTSKDPSAEHQFSLDKAFVAEVPQISGRREVPIEVSQGIKEATAVVGVIGEREDDEIMTEREEFQDTIHHSIEAFAFEGQTYYDGPVGSVSVQSGAFVLDDSTASALDNSTTSALDNSSTLGQNVPSTILSNFAGNSGFMFEQNEDSSEESLPDIVDEDPDSD